MSEQKKNPYKYQEKPYIPPLEEGLGPNAPTPHEGLPLPAPNGMYPGPTAHRPEPPIPREGYAREIMDTQGYGKPIGRHKAYETKKSTSGMVVGLIVLVVVIVALVVGGIFLHKWWTSRSAEKEMHQTMEKVVQTPQDMEINRY